LPLLSAAFLSAGTTGAAAQEVLQPLSNPPQAPIQRQAPAAKTLMALPPGAPGLLDEAVLDLSVTYIDGEIRNPQSGKTDKVRLRGYVGTGTSKDVPFVGPTVEIRPGETLRMTLRNTLPPDSTCEPSGGSANTPNCFNGTNMHTHGLWINPAGNSDNVLISIDPGVDFQYEYNVPPDHPAGTFWYHPHRHGSTALQVSSGMAGALIIRGDRQPTTAANGDLDVLLRRTGDQGFVERILVFQQIQYACRYKDGENAGQIITETDANGNVIAWVCPEDNVGEINGYDQFGPGTWAQSGRFTGINGVIQPLIAETKAGQIERWRMVHAGVRDTISLAIRKHKGKVRDTVTELRTLAAGENDDYIDKYCEAESIPYHLVAADGLTTARAIPTKVATFQPGYRWDALIAFPTAGDYCVIDTSAPAGGTLDSSAPGRRILGFVTAAAGTAVTGDMTAYVQKELEKAAMAHITTAAREQVVADLRNGLRLTKFVPHKDVTAQEVTGTQDLVFNIDTSQIGAAFFEVNGRPYEPGRIDRVLPLGGVDEWTLTSDFVSHPFHIHVNPFQIVSIESPKALGGTRVELAGDGQPDNFIVRQSDGAIVRSDDPKDLDPQYRDLIGVWKDTLWVKSLLPVSKIPPGANPDDYKYIIKVRTRYQRYIGQFVLHCHILDHEDQGMMQNVVIAVPDGKGGASHGHH